MDIELLKMGAWVLGLVASITFLVAYIISLLE